MYIATFFRFLFLESHLYFVYLLIDSVCLYYKYVDSFEENFEDIVVQISVNYFASRSFSLLPFFFRFSSCLFNAFAVIFCSAIRKEEKGGSKKKKKTLVGKETREDNNDKK